MESTNCQLTKSHLNRDLEPRPAVSPTVEMAKRILAEVMNYRRVPEAGHPCGDVNCPKCISVHLPRILAAVQANEAVTFVLPAFPGKSPNPAKVLGPLPDYAERLALQFLGKLCRRIGSYYAPGAKIILCSDGRVFSDVVGMKEDDVTAYRAEIERFIAEMSLSEISTFDLDDHYGALSFVQMREELMKAYGNPLELLKEKVRNGANLFASADDREANRMYCGLARFLFEDSIYPGQTKSRTNIQKDSRARAYEVMRRSNAWTELIAERFPEAVRLSIHPQSCGSKKLGIRLIGDESWMTPWHGVAVETYAGFILLKRSEAEAMNLKLIHAPDGRPSHYRVMDEQRFLEVK